MIGPEDLERMVPGLIGCKNITDAVQDAAVVIIANNHPDLGILPPAALLKRMCPGGFIYDYWNHFSNLSDRELQDAYFSVGNTKGARHE
jgi:UDP-N-acetyl-D-mannosaminuronic acid dehydrogenase